MKNNKVGYFWIIGGVIALSGWSAGKVEAQVNEGRVLRQASGVYQGGLTNSKRVRSDYTVNFDNSVGKMRIPITENNFKSTLIDDELAGANQAKIAADGKTANVKRGGKKINYVLKKGVMDTVSDGHAPIKNGTGRGGSVLRGRDWVGALALIGTRVDNDSMISTYTADANGKH